MRLKWDHLKSAGAVQEASSNQKQEKEVSYIQYKTNFITFIASHSLNFSGWKRVWLRRPWIAFSNLNDKIIALTWAGANELISMLGQVRCLPVSHLYGSLYHTEANVAIEIKHVRNIFYEWAGSKTRTIVITKEINLMAVGRYRAKREEHKWNGNKWNELSSHNQRCGCGRSVKKKK